MKRVTGLGGIFFRSQDNMGLMDWYRTHLGIDSQSWGHQFRWAEEGEGGESGYTVWSPFKEDTKYFEPSTKEFMINYRVADLDSLIPALKEEGVTVVGDIENHENGKFAWILDPEGNKIELWEPMDPKEDPYLQE